MLKISRACVVLHNWWESTASHPGPSEMLAESLQNPHADQLVNAEKPDKYLSHACVKRLLYVVRLVRMFIPVILPAKAGHDFRQSRLVVC